MFRSRKRNNKAIARDITLRQRRALVMYGTVERREAVCEHRQEDKLVGYDVRYRYNGREY